MCFLIPNDVTTASKATKDIKVYKVVYPKKDSKGRTNPSIKRYRSYYKNFEYEDGFQYSNDNFVVRAKAYFRSQGEGQGLHSFHKSHYEVEAKLDRSPTYSSTVLIECYIPKGTMYFFNGTEYFSESLVIVGRVKTKKK